MIKVANILKLALVDAEWLADNREGINDIDDDSYDGIALALCLDLYDKHGSVSHADLIEHAYNVLGEDDLYDEVAEIIQSASKPPTDYIATSTKEQFDKFLRDRCLDNLVNEVNQAYDDGDAGAAWESAQKWVSKKEKIATKNSSAISLKQFDPIGYWDKTAALPKYTTGFEAIDRCLQDHRGVSKQQVFSYLAPTGSGKTWLLAHAAVQNFLSDANVLFITLEMSPEEIISTRICAGLTHMNPSEVKISDIAREEFTKKLRQCYNRPNDLIIDELPSSANIAQITNCFNTATNKLGTPPDVVVLDYLSTSPMKPTNDYTRDESQAAKELVDFAKAQNVAVFTAMQTNRKGVTGQANLNAVGGSYGRTHVMDYVVSINISENKLTLACQKNRYGKPFTESYQADFGKQHYAIIPKYEIDRLEEATDDKLSFLISDNDVSDNQRG